MSEGYAVPKATKHSFKLETQEAVAPVDAASDSVLVNLAPTLRGFTKNWIPDNSMGGHLGRYRPLDGGPADDIGWDAQVKAKGSGTLGVAPELSQYLQCSFGKVSVGVAGTVDASPTPTTTGATLTGATVQAGHLADIEMSGGDYETRRILSEAAGAVTWWPPTSEAPASGANVRPGVAYILTSTHSETKSGSGFFYFQNGEKLVMSGARGNARFTLGIRQPMLIDFAMQGIVIPAVSQTSIGYTWAPPDFAIVPPMCLGVALHVYIPALVGAGASSTSVPLTYPDGSTAYYEATDAVANPTNPDQLIVDVGSSVYETKDIATWTYSTQTATCTALGGTPSEGNNAYIRRIICIPDTLIFDAGHIYTRLDCMSATSGWSGQRLTGREATVEWSEYFKSFVDFRLLQQADFIELHAVVGSTSGNKIAICAPNILRETYNPNFGGEYIMNSIAGGAYSNLTAGNDEMFLTFL
jgi:hypothetical protein